MFLIIGILIAIGFFTVVVFILSLFFGGEDPYERELAEMDRHDELIDTIRDQGKINNSININDSRSIHFHNHTHKRNKKKKI